MTAQTTTYHKAESFLFSFRENSDMFLADYGDNAYQLERMGRLLDASRNRLLKGNSHLLTDQKEDRLYDTLHGHNLPSLHGGTGRHKERHHIGRSPLLSQPGNGSHCNGSRYWQTTEVVYIPHTHAPDHGNCRYGRYKKQHIREEYRNSYRRSSF